MAKCHGGFLPDVRLMLTEFPASEPSGNVSQNHSVIISVNNSASGSGSRTSARSRATSGERSFSPATLRGLGSAGENGNKKSLVPRNYCEETRVLRGYLPLSSFLGRQLLATPAGREEWLVTQRPTGSLRDHLPLYTALPKMFHPKVILLFQRSPGVAPYFIWDLPSAYGIQANDLISFAISRNDVVPRTLTLHSQKRKKGKTERKARRSCHRAALHSCPSTPGYAVRTQRCPAAALLGEGRRAAMTLVKPSPFASDTKASGGRGNYVFA